MYVCSVYVNIFTSSPLKLLGRLKPNFIRSLLGKGETKVYSNGPGHLTKMAAMSIYGKNLKKNLLLRNQTTDDFEILYATLGAQVLPSLFKMMTLG